MTYWLNLFNDGSFALLPIEDENLDIYEGHLSDAGITEENDPQWTNKLDDYFESQYGIKPSEWEVG